MSEELIRQNQELVQATLGPYFRCLSPGMKQSKEGKELDTAEQLANMLAQIHFQDSLRVGTQIIFSQIPKRDNFHKLSKDWGKFVVCVQDTFSDFANKSDDEVEINHDTMQEVLGITPSLMQEFYDLGVESYQDRDLVKALGVMGLISLLNPFLFEPWLVQGMIHTQNHNSPQALFTLTMGAIVNYEHPACHLCMAQVYWDIQDRSQAKISYEIAQSFLNECADPQWQNYANNLKTKVQL